MSRASPQDREAGPLYRQVYERFRGAIAQGTLKPGDRIPSARSLAKEMGVARGTVEVAYSLLASEGYIQARGQAGTVVSPNLQPQAGAPAPPAPEPPAHDVPAWPRWSGILPFQIGLPALDAFPRKLWARLGARQLRGLQAAELAYPPSSGLPALRAATGRGAGGGNGDRHRVPQVVARAPARRAPDDAGGRSPQRVGARARVDGFLGDLLVAVGTINTWNMLGITTHLHPAP